MALAADTGNPDTYLNFFGQFQVTLSTGVISDIPYVMKTNNNLICFLSDVEFPANTSPILTLPTECVPGNDLRFPCYFDDGNGNITLEMVIISSQTGNLDVLPHVRSQGGLLYLNGLTFSMNSAYYS